MLFHGIAEQTELLDGLPPGGEKSFVQRKLASICPHPPSRVGGPLAGQNIIAQTELLDCSPPDGENSSVQTLLASVGPLLQDHSLRKTALKARDSSLERLFALVLALFHDLLGVGGSLGIILRAPEGEHADAGNNARDPNGEANLQPEMVQELRVLLVEDSTDDRGQKNKKSGVDGDEDGLRIQLKSAVDVVELHCRRGNCHDDPRCQLVGCPGVSKQHTDGLQVDVRDAPSRPGHDRW
mmetsp:Transcript_27050/g.89828  ORF Transcript_27050/g.89828 Transcript_27050/m.89828 type:complete len:239 (+) Transcript_27050:42-758(+)